MRALWGIAGFVSLALGMIGVFLPLLPTVPFLLLSAFCFGRSSQRLHDWLLQHPRFGPPIADWREHGEISFPAKRLATLAVALTFAVSLYLGVRSTILVVQAIALACVLVFIWTRPSRSSKSPR